MRGLLVLLLCGSVSACLVTDDDSGSKKLHGEKGYFKQPAQVSREEKNRRRDAEKSINKLCGKALHKRRWVEDGRVPNKEHFMAFFTKAKSCDEQIVMIDLKAAQFMQAKSITCSLTDDSYLRFEIPQSSVYSDRIRVDCDSEVIDLRSDGSSLSISTLEKNGSTNLAVIDSFGKWDNKIEEISRGLSRQELNKLDEAISEARDSGPDFSDRLMKWTNTGGFAYFGGWLVASGTGTSILLAAGAAPVVVAAAPYVAAFAVGYGMWRVWGHLHKGMSDRTPQLFLMHKSIGGILEDFKS